MCYRSWKHIEDSKESHQVWATWEWTRLQHHVMDVVIYTFPSVLHLYLSLCLWRHSTLVKINIMSITRYCSPDLESWVYVSHLQGHSSKFFQHLYTCHVPIRSPQWVPQRVWWGAPMGGLGVVSHCMCIKEVTCTWFCVAGCMEQSVRVLWQLKCGQLGWGHRNWVQELQLNRKGSQGQKI